MSVVRDHNVGHPIEYVSRNQYEFFLRMYYRKVCKWNHLLPFYYTTQTFENFRIAICTYALCVSESSWNVFITTLHSQNRGKYFIRSQFFPTILVLNLHSAIYWTKYSISVKLNWRMRNEMRFFKDFDPIAIKYAIVKPPLFHFPHGKGTNGSD